ncbi:MAG: hypothetical protein OEX18_12330 [Candidatus Krumholzibacteria bacterium]|nr:hypothetical protein [Candidatus Krumholzibacteria bacterium]MDH4338051.1 hypothetical protein [Candidatus Krumholzibacteria bacterium]MDH5269402.1 hypothetical protein [Candidatus Krumholzibacteria bacterium]MDH5627325.1 hypothetical protein [Candidatus Krumholzibacteria bacterium]
MPVTTHVNPENSLVTFECSGTLLLAEVEQAFEAMIGHPSFRPGINAMWDIRNASIGLYAQQIPDLLRMIRERQSDRGKGYRVAILVSGSPDFGLSTLFEMSAHAMPFEVRVFRSHTQATQWLAGQAV